MILVFIGLLTILPFIVNHQYWEQNFPKQKECAILPKNKEQLWLFILAGQSNMAGRGFVEAEDTISSPDILTIDENNNWILAKEPLHFYQKRLKGLGCGLSFAKELKKAIPNSIKIGIIPCAIGGSSIEQWIGDSILYNVKLKSNFVEKVAIARNVGVIKGILWHQGEANANMKGLIKYKQQLSVLFNDFRNYIGDVTIPIMIGELGRYAIPNEKQENWDKINCIINEYAISDSNCFVVSSIGLSHKGDHVHFNTVAQRELGKRFANTYKKLILNTL